jgi:hypothetical protein
MQEVFHKGHVIWTVLHALGKVKISLKKFLSVGIFQQLGTSTLAINFKHFNDTFDLKYFSPC